MLDGYEWRSASQRRGGVLTRNSFCGCVIHVARRRGGDLAYISRTPGA